MTRVLTFPRLSVKVLCALFAVTACFVCAPVARAASSNIIFSQVFGAGPDSGSPVYVKYVELFNKSQAAVTLTTTGTASGIPWSIQYTSATSVTGVVSTANTFPIELPTSACTTQVNSTTAPVVAGCAVTIPAGGYFLIAGAAGSIGTAPTVAIDETNAMTLSATSGRVFLVNDSTPLASTAGNATGSFLAPGVPTTADPSVVDFVGYGTAYTWDGTAAAPVLTDETAEVMSNPCNYTGNNIVDFPTSVTVTVNTPHDSGSAVHLCPGVAPTASGVAVPASQTAGFSTVLTVNVVPNTGLGITVTANLSAFGLGTAVPFTGNSGSTVFTYTLPIPNSQAVTSYSITATVKDTQLDTIPAVTIPLTVTANVPITSIHTIQGTPPTVSSYIGQTVNISGIVTGVRSNGFYIQEPDAAADTNLATPEGIYVNTGGSAPPVSVVVGNNLQVSGVVTAPITATGYLASPLEIDTPSGYGVISTGNALPTPITLTSTNLSPTGTTTQLLQYQSMRVTAPSLTSTSGTSGTLTETAETYTSNGQFYGVLTGVAQPFRAAGADSRDAAPTSGAPTAWTRWSAPTNLLLIDSAALGGAALDVTTGSTLVPTTGVLDYSSGQPDLMISAVTAERPVVSVPTAAPAASTASSSSTLTVATLDMQRFYDTETSVTGATTITTGAYNGRLAKASNAIRNMLSFPDVIAVQEVESLTELTALATQITTDAATNSQTNPAYVGTMGTVGPNGYGNGFLTKSTKVTVSSSSTFGSGCGSYCYTNPTTGTNAAIWDTPPMYITANVARGSISSNAYAVYIMNAEMLPATGINSNTVSGLSTVGAGVRAKRLAQAQQLAGSVGVLGTAHPLILAGSVNAYEFSDGYVDVNGILTNTQVAQNTVVSYNSNTYATTLTDLVPTLAATTRYTANESGVSDTLDHIYYSSNTPAGTTLQAVHIDSDYNVTALNTTTTPYRTSSHDALVATVQVPALPAALTFNPSTLSLTFPAQIQNTSSASKPIVVTNTSTTTAITITSIVASMGFSQTNNCGTSIAALGTCTINVVFSPTTVGSPTGTVVLTDSDTTGTQTISLNGTSYALVVTNTALTASPTAPVLTQTVTLTATVPGNGTTAPTGSVTFKDGTNVLCSAVNVAGSATSVSAPCAVSTFTATSHSLTAVYTGDTVYATSTGTLSLTVAAITSATTNVTASPTSTTYGLPVTLTAGVSSNLGVPTGTVQFYDSGTAIGTPQTLVAGVATLVSTTIPVGSNSITATYLGTTSSPVFPTSSSATGTSVTIGPALVLDFTLTLGSPQLIVGGPAPSATTGILITTINNLVAPITFTCSGLPAAATCSFNPATVTPAGTAISTLTITTTAAANHVPHMGLGSGLAFAFTLLVAPFAFRKRNTALRMLALLVMLIAGAQSLTGCGGGTNTVPTSATVTVTATATTLQTHSATITLVTQ